MMYPRLSSRLVVLAAACIAWGAVAAPIVLPASYPQDTPFDAYVGEKMNAENVVGCAVGIIDDGKVVYIGTYGLADRETKTPVTRDSSFRWASISKPLTAVAALQLVERDKLDLDGDVRTYVPEFPEKEAPITSRQLLAHLGGIVHYTNGKIVRTRARYDIDHPYTSVINALDRFKESPLVATPGERFSYSTHGYILLSAVVERAGGAPYWEQVRQRIATPLGMTTLQPDHAHLDIPHRVTGYRWRRGEHVESLNDNVGWKLGGGGFTSNIDDLARFALGVLNDTLLKPDTRERMWTRQTTRDGKRIANGLGLAVGGKGEDLRVSHSGGQNKTRTMLILYPRRGDGVVFMTNSENVKPSAFAADLLRQWKQHPDTPYSAPEVATE